MDSSSQSLPQPLRGILDHLFRCTKASLKRRCRDLREESRPDNPKSVRSQVAMLEVVFRRLQRGVDILRTGDWQSAEAERVLRDLRSFCESISVRIETDVRNADHGNWTAPARILVLQARRQLRRIQKSAGEV